MATQSCLKNPHGQGSLVGYSPWSHKESDTAERLSTAQHDQVRGNWEKATAAIHIVESVAFMGESALSPWTSQLTFRSLYSPMRASLLLPTPTLGFLSK